MLKNNLFISCFLIFTDKIKYRILDIFWEREREREKGEGGGEKILYNWVKQLSR